MPAPKKLDTKLENIKEEKEDQEQVTARFAEDSRAKDDDTRQKVAMWCVVGYFAGLILVLTGVPMYNYAAYTRAPDHRLMLDLKDTLLAYQAVVGTLIGAVVAYYFKTKLDNKEK
jgi:hypothetical protein